MMDRFFDVLNTPIAVLIVLVVAVGINAFLYFEQRPSGAPAAPPADRGELRTTVERTERRVDSGEATRSAAAPKSPTPTQPTASATASATATATASATASSSSSP